MLKIRGIVKLVTLILAFIFIMGGYKAHVDSINSYGVLCYNYKKKLTKNGRYDADHVNLGDYIQSLAARQYLPSNSKPILVDRDELNHYNGKNIKLIMNQWCFLNSDNNQPSSKIDPIYVSYHINNGNDIDETIISYLKKHEPIGCRDYYTKNLLTSNGIESYFSSCLTTTLDKKYLSENKRSGIIFCDYNFGDFPEADKCIKSLKNYDFNNIVHTTHIYPKNSSHEDRFNKSEELLKMYSKAGLVITTRIHCALPCLALKTPVILINKNYDHKRFDGLYDLLNTIGKDKSGKFSSKIKKNDSGEVINPDGYIRYSDNLKRNVEQMLKP